MTEYRMPKVNNNDAVYVLLEWAVPDGGKAAAGEPLLEVETSKAVEELLAPQDGLLEQLAEPGREYPPGALLARLHPDAGALEAARQAAGTETPDAAGPSPQSAAGPVVTAPARALLAELGIPEAEVRALGVPLVRRAEVEQLAAARSGAAAPSAPAAARQGAEPAAEAEPPGTVVTPLSRVQRAVAATVTASHREVPPAFTAVEVDVTDALAVTRALSTELGTLVGLPELTLAALAARRAADPACFGSLTGDGTAVRLVPGAHIGVTFDLGGGLYVPVVRDADRTGLGELARTLLRHRMAALRGAFRDADLQGANITLTLHTDPGIAFAVPIVFPGQACALSLAAPRAVAVPDGNGGFRARQLVHLGAAFDHRLVNGREVVALLRGVKELLEEPRRLTEEDE
ncbi:2-oxo acid dehydrogenase subunit E2 [Streptomyces sp. NPDC092296]|uniref:2-oxo acid dehydrogenase subunit E2 n=1 Tax=Streptomyces sp. NPDC092296 TaxID=3366012 RepID=UPI0037FF75B7